MFYLLAPPHLAAVFLFYLDEQQIPLFTEPCQHRVTLFGGLPPR